MYTLYVGVDVSKDSFSARGLDNKGDTCFSLTADMSYKGFLDLLNALSSHSSSLSSVIVGMESTGCYHINLFSFLTEKDIHTVVINPLLISNFAKLSLRKTKTDKKDALTIATFVMLNKDSITELSISQDYRDLRDMARERESLNKFIASTKNDIKRNLQSTFPELESMCNVFSKTMLCFLAEYPSARLIKSAKLKAIAKVLQPSDKRMARPFTAEEILAAAKKSVATMNPAKEIILKGKISTLQHLERRLDEISEILTNMCKAMMIEDLKILISIKGINMKTAVPFLAELGGIERFSSYKKLIAFIGIDPSIYQSGKYKGTGKISKRGSRHLRRILYSMVMCVVRYNSFFRSYHLRRKAEGLPPKKSFLATAHKLIRVIFAMLSHKTYFAANQNA